MTLKINFKSGTGDSSGCIGDTSVRVARKRDTTRHNTAKLNQPRQDMAAPKHRYAAREKLSISTVLDGFWTHHAANV